jgi:FkbM family methyltransferase
MSTLTRLKVETHGGLRFAVRGEFDSAVCKEVAAKRCYERPRLGFGVRDGETWLDCGANIGAFAVWAERKHNAHVFGYEACEENTELAKQNLALNQCRSVVRTAFVTAKSGGRTSVNFNPRTPARSSATAKGSQRFVENISLAAEIQRHSPHGLKIDIEGGEFSLLDTGLPLQGIRALAIEYHFRFDKDCEKARRRIAPLLAHFRHNSVPKTVFTHSTWPAWQDAILFFWS